MTFFLEQHLPLTSRRKIRKLLDGGEVFINDKRIWLAKFQVRKGDKVVVLNPTRKEDKLQREAILFQNEDFLVINKPAGVVVEDGAGTFPVLKELEELGYTGLQLVHRLDKETSGLLLLAKNRATRQQLVANWSKVQKTYLAICLGKCPQPGGIINTPITPCSMLNDPAGTDTNIRYRSALTFYKVMAYRAAENISLIECRPKTGRTHQLRIHLASVGLPIVGDKLYSGHFAKHTWSQKVSRQMLHAYRMEFSLSNRSYVFVGPLPADFRNTARVFRPTCAL